MKQISAIIIDDSEIDRWILNTQLSEAGVSKIFEADDGSTGLSFFENHTENLHLHGDSFPPELIFLDVNMPNVDGFEFLVRFSELRTQFPLSNCTIFIYSASEHIEELAMFTQFDFVNNFITKGKLTIDVLKEKLSTVL